MTLERKPVVIHYRRFDRNGATVPTLENLVRSAMNTPTTGGALVKERYLERLFKIVGDNYFINVYAEGESGNPLVFGDILHFTSGHLQALCKTANPLAATVPVQQMEAPAQSEYVHSQMFWMIKGDHVLLTQSLSLRTEDFEKYLKWLLASKTSNIPSASSVALVSKFDEDQIGGDLGDIQEIVVGGLATSAVAPLTPLAQLETLGDAQQDSEITTDQGINTGRRTGWSTAKRVLSELLGGDANVESLMNAVPADAELNVQVHIGYQTKKRNVDRVALRQLESGLRNIPDSQLEVRSKNGKVASDGTIRLHYPASIKLIKMLDGDNVKIGSLIDPEDALRAMREAYVYFVANGKIQP